ncbi:MAG: hypothetical protein ABJB74_18725 [Gemmatimonas sp.]
MPKHVLLAALGTLFTSGALVAQVATPASQKTDVPVQSVMLFSSGVGFFEHAGIVRGNSATELRFKTSQINDILKSLVLQDQDGGRVTAITYPSQDPVAKTLRSFQVDITSNPSLASLLNQLRGARVSIQSRAEHISGSVLGVETRTITNSNDKTTETPVLNLLTGATIRAIELPSITSLSLDDPKLQDELTKALGALSQARDKDKKPVTISFNGAGERRVRIGYVVETPIWKTSYRLLLDDKSNHLQGWAIVENQTESDWNDVSLSLVSGRPMSFMMDLYQPLYLARPTVTQELFTGLRPRVYDAGIDANTDVVSMESEKREIGGAGGRGGGRGEDFAARGVKGGTATGVGNGPPVPLMGKVAGAVIAAASPPVFSEQPYYEMSVQSSASASRMGELFQYSIGNVTLARQKSAMLPIITDTVSIDRLSIYNASVLARNPLNGVRIKNTTGKHLLEGPVTVLDQNRYAGDAQINNVPPGQQRLLSYGIDLEMTVDNTKGSSESNIVSGRIVKGVLTLENKLVSTREYRAENKGDNDKTLLIEHPSLARGGYKLVDTQKPVETTDDLYRFEGKAPAHKVTVLVVKEEVVRSTSIAMVSADLNYLLSFTRTGEIPAAVKETLSKVIALKRALVDIDRDIADKMRQTNEITAEQSRLRENMKTVAQNSDYYKRLLQKLNDQESQLEKLANERTQLQSRRDAQRNELEQFLSTLNVG